jgi:hypothetical protein
VTEHTHAVNAAVNGLSALPGTARPFAATRARSRFRNNDDVPFPAVREPAQDAVRDGLATSTSPFALCVHDWCRFAFTPPDSKRDRDRRSHDHDLGYELGTALLVDASDGRTLGPMELRLRTADGLLSTRAAGGEMPPGHLDEVLAVMTESANWKLGKTPVPVIDREADSVGHYRAWHAAGHRFVVRADTDRRVQWNGSARNLADGVRRLETHFTDLTGADGAVQVVTIQAGSGKVRVAATEVILHRPARHYTGELTVKGNQQQVSVPGPPPPRRRRLVVTRVVSAEGKVLAQWCLLTNLTADEADAATVGRWYAWRWRIETLHKLLKSAGLNAEEWQQESGAAFLRRLCVAVSACVTVWQLQGEAGEEAVRLRKILVRLSGRQMKHRVESTAPALLAGLEKLLAIDDLLRTEDLQAILALARKVLPKLFRTE